MSDVRETVARVHRDEWARVVATIARRFGDLDIAEDATAEAFATALEHWATHGVPPNPGGWLTTTAGNKALDRVRREGRRDAKEEEAQMLGDQLSGPAEPVFTDGPFVESKEYLAGFWVIEAPDLDVALALSADASRACHRKIEVRPFDGIA